MATTCNCEMNLVGPGVLWCPECGGAFGKNLKQHFFAKPETNTRTPKKEIIQNRTPHKENKKINRSKLRP